MVSRQGACRPLLDRTDVGPISKQAGLSNQCLIATASTAAIATPSGMGIDNESDQVP